MNPDFDGFEDSATFWAQYRHEQDRPLVAFVVGLFCGVVCGVALTWGTLFYLAYGRG